MKAMAAGVMAVLTLLLGMMGCGKTQIVPTVPEEKTVPGTLIGIHYSRTAGALQDLFHQRSSYQPETGLFFPAPLDSL